MDKEKIIKAVTEWVNKAPTFADFGLVDDIESDDEVIQIFY